MLSYIYIPFDAFQRSSWLKNVDDFLCMPHQIIGYRVENCYIIMDIIKETACLDFTSLDPSLGIIGSTNSDTPAADHHLIYLRFEPVSKFPYVDAKVYDQDQRFTIVFFKPPNLQNLEYFTVRPILLQSTDMAHKKVSYDSNILMLHQEENSLNRLSICNESFLEKINGCAEVRSRIKAQCTSKRMQRPLQANLHQIFLPIRKLLLRLLIWLVGVLLSILVWLITSLNTEILGMNPVKTSTWCRQLDLRLRQVSYFPFQFLSYYGTKFLKPRVRSQLGIPMTNERHNVNNSNYINLYNTIWLMTNDVLIGSTIFSVVSSDLDAKIHLVNTTLRNVCFTRLDSFISWIGSDYPGGFKLNNDLGQFMELLFLWTSQTCRETFKFLALSAGPETWFIFLVKLWFKLSCYLGLSFLTAFLIDYIKIVNILTHVFYLAATKIYFRQVEMLKSLFQLFRGRKYNVLRNRIDKIEEDQLRIEQLLLGTFVFLILIYLLPTTFAFYCLFFAYKLTMSTCLKLGDKVILCLNIYPLFAVLLKLKNSRRLQGGVHFTHKGSHENTDWLIMTNKALTFDEIWGNFFHVFRQEGRIERLFFNFVEGLDLQVRDTSSMKFQYLMLPKNYGSLLNIWKETSDDGL